MKNILRTFTLAVVVLIAMATAPPPVAGFTSGASALPNVFQSTAYASPAATQSAPDQYYHHVWELVQGNFLYQDRMTDWNTWEHKYDGKLKNMDDAEKAVDAMLSSLKDPYTFFKDESRTKAESANDNARGVVKSRMLPGNIGYIQITTFGSNNTADETEAACKALPGATAYVVDLRENRGGYIMQAAQVFSLFVDKATFTTMKGVSEAKPYTEEYRVTATGIEVAKNGQTSTSPRKPNLIGGKPVVVLVNGNSASASEMLSGALRDNGAAELLGTKTFGKGIAQWHFHLDYNTSVQVTFAQYYLPSNVCIQGVGLLPAHNVAPAASGDNQLDEAVKVLRSKIAP